MRRDNREGVGEIEANPVPSLLQRYERLAVETSAAEGGRATWTGEEQALLEEVEAMLRQKRRQQLQRVVQEADDGFFLDTTERVWVSYGDLIGEITAIFGIRGSGKSNTVALLAEKLVLRGVPLTIIDPHGEYYSLRLLPRPLLVIGIPGGTATHADLLVEPDQATAIAEFSVHEGVSIVLDVSGLKDAVRYEVLGYYFEGLWTACAREKRPYHLFLEEAHTFIPERGSSPVEAIVSNLATEYRKYGVGMVVVDQRPANVKKTPITQARVRLLHEVDDPLDIDRYKQYVPRRYGKRLEDLLASFEAGTALVKIRKEIDIIQVQQRETAHIGVTPSLDGPTMSLEIAPDDQLAQRLAAVLEQLPRPKRRRGSSGEGNKLHDLQTRLRDVEAENLVLREQLALLGVLRVTSGDVPLEANLEQAASTSLVNREEATLASSVLQDHLEDLRRQVGQLEEENARLHAEVVRLHSSSDSEERARGDQGITNVHFEQAHIESFYAGAAATLPPNAVNPPEPEVTEVTEVASEPVLELPPMSSAAFVQGLKRSERQMVERVRRNVQALSTTEKHLFLWLIEHDGQSFTSRDLADAVNVDQRSLWSGKTEKLSALAFVTRTGSRGMSLQYRMTFGAYCRRYLPDVKDEQQGLLIDYLVQAAS